MPRADTRVESRVPGACECGALTWDLGPNGALIIEGVGHLSVWQEDDGIVVLGGRCFHCGDIDLGQTSSAQIAESPLQAPSRMR